MKIEITNDDIDLGEAGDCSTCAAALAINRVAPSGWRAHVDGDSVSMFNAAERRRVEFGSPDELILFVDHFDRWASCEEMKALGEHLHCPAPERPEPMTFELPLEELAS